MPRGASHHNQGTRQDSGTSALGERRTWALSALRNNINARSAGEGARTCEVAGVVRIWQGCELRRSYRADTLRSAASAPARNAPQDRFTTRADASCARGGLHAQASSSSRLTSCILLCWRATRREEYGEQEHGWHRCGLGGINGMEAMFHARQRCRDMTQSHMHQCSRQ